MTILTSPNGVQHEAPWGVLFRKTSCAVAYAHGEADYNGHYGIRELCDICPKTQLGRCASAWQAPDPTMVTETARALGAVGKVDVTERAILVEGLDEPPRYYLQHGYGYQCHDRHRPGSGRDKDNPADRPVVVTVSSPCSRGAYRTYIHAEGTGPATEAAPAGIEFDFEDTGRQVYINAEDCAGGG